MPCACGARGKRPALWPSFAVDFLARMRRLQAPRRPISINTRNTTACDADARLREWAERMGAGRAAAERRRAGAALRRAAARSAAPPRTLERSAFPPAGTRSGCGGPLPPSRGNGREHGREIAFTVATNCAPDRLGAVQALAAKWAAEEQVPVVVLGEEISDSYARRLASGGGRRSSHRASSPFAIRAAPALPAGPTGTSAAPPRRPALPQPG